MEGILLILLVLILAAVLINFVVPGGVTGMPGILIFLIVAVLIVAGGYYGSEHVGPLFPRRR